MSHSNPNVVAAGSVREYFHDAFHSATKNQDLDFEEVTAAYVVNLLSTYTHSRALCAVSDAGKHHKPLAEIYAEALAAESIEQRHQALKRLGDIALFIAGIFTDSLRRRVVDVDYYIGMGGTAYSSLHESLSERRNRFGHTSMFAELGEKFPDLVDVLSEISEASGLKSNHDLLRTYEMWQSTGSERARKQLERQGIYAIPINNPRAAH